MCLYDSLVIYLCHSPCLYTITACINDLSNRSSLGEIVLQLKALGVTDVLKFDFMDRPPQQALGIYL